MTDPTRAPDTDPLSAMESTATAVAAFSGVKQQFLDAGWSEKAAERMVGGMLQLEIARMRAGAVN